MATTIDEICRFLDEDGIYHIGGDEVDTVLLGFQTEQYRRPDGDDRINVAVRLDHDGEFISVFAPELYSFEKGRHLDKVFRAFSEIQYRTQLIRYELDSRDGEVRAGVYLPLEDGQLTANQLRRMLASLVATVDQYHPIIIQALETGRIELARPKSPLEERFDSLLEGFEPQTDA